MVSIKDIALRCGVSVSTVSKALNGRGDVGEATKEQILDVAKELGYTANSAARALKTNRTYSIGIVFTDLSNSGFTHEYFASMLNYFRMEAERRGYDITFISDNMGPTNTSYLQHVRARGLDGVAIICADFFDPMIQELACADLPIVSLDHAFNNRTAVLSDNMRGMESLVRYVYGKGHRRIAYIHGNQTAVTENRLTGFYRACEGLGLTIPDGYVTECVYHEPVSCHEATKRLLALPERPTCILVCDDYAAMGALRAIGEAGLRVPQDISLAGYDGIEQMQAFHPRITTVYQDAPQLGRGAAALLLSCLTGKPVPPVNSIPCRLIRGETVCAPA